MKLELDQNGMIATKPLTGFLVTDTAGSDVMLAIEYIQTPEELETGARHQICLLLKPQTALGVSAELERLAKRLLEPPAEPVPKSVH